MDLAPDDPRTLGRYRALSRLGVGGMGRVLLGEDESGRRVALKIVHAELAADPGFRERFRREIRMAASAPPWFTAPVLDADPDAARPWLATAYVEGPSLQSYVTEQGPLGEPGVAALAVRMADGLAALHGSGLVHRDLKPSNVLLAEDGPRLIDFGISRAADTTSLTRTGHVLGTPAFMSPEQAMGERDIGPSSDMFSYGALLVFAATGRSPFAADTPTATLHRILTTEAELGPLTGRVREVVQACLVKDTSARPTAGQVRSVLREGQEPTAPGPAVTEAAVAAAVPTGPIARMGAVPAPVSGRAHPPDRPTVAGGRVPPTPPRSSRRRGAVVAAVAAAVLLVAAVVVGAVLLQPGGAAPDAAVAPSTSAPTGAATAPPSTAPGEDVTIIEAPQDPRFGADPVRFATPSGNIACLMTEGTARCDVLANGWTLPPKPADCDLDFGGGATLGTAGPAQLNCAGDTVADAALTVLEYGEAVRFAGVTCTSRETGLRCENPVTGHGFQVSRAAYDLF